MSHIDTTFLALKTSLRGQIWPAGEPSNLIGAHDKMFVEALVNIQQSVDCLQYNNTSIFPHCSTFYQCGMTILHAPRGTIGRVYLVDRINPITGLEDRLARTDWCNRVDAEQVAFHKLEEETSCYPQTLPLLGINERAFPQGLRQMGRGADRINGRAGHAQWALHRGRIYVSPWIQSGEAVVVEWDGIQTDWLNSHLVDSDPLLARAIRYFVIAQDARDFGADPITSDRAEQAFQEARRELMYNCHQQTRVRGIEPSNARRSISLSEMAGLGGGETLSLIHI